MPACGDNTKTAMDARVRLLLIKTCLFENTDERHSMTMRELISHLEFAGCPADRRTVASDIAQLRRSGMDIRVRRKAANEYYLASRRFEWAELRILTDMVRASCVLSRERSEAMIEKLASLTSRHDATRLRRPSGCTNPHKAESERAFLNAERILSAIEHGKKLSFVYCQYTEKKSLTPRRGGETYVVNPCRLVYAEDHYYLIADHPIRDGLAHYRLDKMTNVNVLREPAAPADLSFDASAYTRTVFSMAPAEQRWVRLMFERRHLGAMVDRFGADVPMEQVDDRTYALFAPVCVSPPFFGWVFQFGGGVCILAPDDVREQMLLMLEAARCGERALTTESGADNGGNLFVSYRTR